MFQLTYFLIVCIIIMWKITKRYTCKSDDKTLELSGKLPLIGHVLRFSGDREQGARNIKSLSEECLQKGGLSTVYFGPNLINLLANPEDCLKVTNLCLEKNTFYDIAKPLLGSGLTIAKVPQWKKNRRILNTAFNKPSLNSFLVVFNRQSRKLVKMLSDNAGKGYFSHDVEIQRINFESICLSSLGINEENYGVKYESILNDVSEIMDIFYLRFNKFWLHSDFLYNMTSLKKRQDEVLRRIDEFTSIILAEKKKALANGNITTEGTNKTEFTPFMDSILKMAVDTGCFESKDILYETKNIMIGGFDTSSSLATFVLTLLGSYPKVQDKVYKEIEQVLGETNRDVIEEDLPKLVYMEAVVKETLRLYPLAALAGRYLDRDVCLKDYTLKAGSTCLILYWGLHRHPVWGEDAELFRPERWFEDTLPNLHSSFGGFSLGRRNCIGRVYAMMSIKATLVHILRSYKIKSDISRMVLKIDVLLRPQSGHEIMIDKR